MQRQLKKEVKIGSIKIGGTNPIAVQTMLNVPVKDIAGNVAQAERVAKAGCQIVRVTVPLWLSYKSGLICRRRACHPFLTAHRFF